MTGTEARLRRLVEVATQLTSTLDLQELLQAIIAATAELLSAESSSILLLDESRNELVFKVSSASPELAGTRMPASVSDTLAGGTREPRRLPPPGIAEQRKPRILDF